MKLYTRQQIFAIQDEAFEAGKRCARALNDAIEEALTDAADAIAREDLPLACLAWCALCGKQVVMGDE